MPQDDLREKKQTVKERMKQSIISRAGEGIFEGASETASEMVKYKLQKKLENKIKRPDTPLAPTPEPKRY